MKTIISILGILYCLSCQSQSDTVNKPYNCHYNLKLAYNSSIIYPGLTTGIEIPVLCMKYMDLIVKPSLKSFYKKRYISGTISWYHHPQFHDNIYLTIEWLLRRIRSDGFSSEFSIGPGVSRTFLAGTTYEVNDNGTVSIDHKAGYYYAMITAGGGFGYDFSMKKKIPVLMYTRFNMITMFPYNSTIYFRPVLELGIKYSPRKAKALVKKT